MTSSTSGHYDGVYFATVARHHFGSFHHLNIRIRRLLPLSESAGDSLIAKAQPIVYRSAKVLLSPEVAFGGLDRSVAEQELDLFEIATGPAAQLRAGAAEVVWPQFSGIDQPTRVRLHNGPDRAFIDALSPDRVAFVDRL